MIRMIESSKWAMWHSITAGIKIEDEKREEKRLDLSIGIWNTIKRTLVCCTTRINLKKIYIITVIITCIFSDDYICYFPDDNYYIYFMLNISCPDGLTWGRTRRFTRFETVNFLSSAELFLLTLVLSMQLGIREKGGACFTLPFSVF
ncbi:hypothetical protein ACJX0J_026263, partial [Zea mays]